MNGAELRIHHEETPRMSRIVRVDLAKRLGSSVSYLNIAAASKHKPNPEPDGARLADGRERWIPEEKSQQRQKAKAGSVVTFPGLA
jgi:hypothetical protein